MDLEKLKVNGVFPEFKKQNSDGTLEDLSLNYINYLSTKNKLASYVDNFNKLSTNERLDVALRTKEAANKLFSKSLFKEATELYLQVVLILKIVLYFI